MKIYFYSLLLLFVAFSCKKDNPASPSLPSAYSHGVWVVNQGNYGGGNATLTFYNKTSQVATTDIFSLVNNRPIGDVFQSMKQINGHYYLVVNNSGKIEVNDTATLKNTAEITGFNSPRYILPVSSSKAYVSDLYEYAVWVVDLNKNTIIKKFHMSSWTEQMAIVNNEVFTTQVKANKIDVVDISKDSVTDSIPLNGYEPQWIVLDKNNKLWVLCDGGINNHIPTLHTIDPATHKVLNTISFPSNLPKPSQLTISMSGDTLYFLCNGINKMGINQTSLPSAPFITAQGRLLFGLGIDPSNGDIYTSDAIDYIQLGEVYRYTGYGRQTDMFKAGICPGGFCFGR